MTQQAAQLFSQCGTQQLVSQYVTQQLVCQCVTEQLDCRSEASLTVALWFHSLAVVGAILPLSLGYPSPPVLPTFKEWVPLLAIAACSCVNQVCLNRGFQLEVAAKASAVNYTQVS